MQKNKITNALLAQLDRVTGYEPVGQGFESLTARIVRNSMKVLLFRIFLLKMPFSSHGTNLDYVRINIESISSDNLFS